MKTIFTKTVIAAGLFAAGVFATAYAQEKNVIEEIKLSNQDGFNELRNQLISNFDFTNPNLTEGTVNSRIEFNVAENGKLSNIHANSECKYVSEELENIMKGLLLKVDPQKIAGHSVATVYVLPVSVTVED